MHCLTKVKNMCSIRIRLFALTAMMFAISPFAFAIDLREKLLGSWRTQNVGAHFPMQFGYTFEKSGHGVVAYLSDKREELHPRSFEWSLDGTILHIGTRDSSGRIIDGFWGARTIQIEGDSLRAVGPVFSLEVWTRRKK